MHGLALLFPGQGAQEAGMGRDTADAFPDAVFIWKQAEQASSLPLRAIYWEGDEAEMSDTRALQPALAAANLALWERIAPRVRPAAAAGHSLGEYCALAAAGVLSTRKVLEIVALRGRLMAEADPQGRGTMCAIVRMDQAGVEALVRDALRDGKDENLRIANYNTPTQFVISGEAAAVERAAALAKERKARALPLKVGGAFHSPFMADAAKELATALRRLVWNAPRFPVYCNALGRAAKSGEDVREAVLVQMTSSVRWIETIGAQWKDGIRRWLELGPKALLSKMVLPILSALPEAKADECRAETLRTAEEISAFQG
jgi:[acyl-carrier-protein] S-malonyltransferase